ncbi:MAG: DUF4065 domain-containing protein [Endomicrobium sp.]|nr:DUF4065 domain-containing protein [Endomicrobium sp.]
MNALEIAKIILNYQNLESTLKISHLKLQKLLFYCQAYHLSILETPLFEENILAWDYGPVIHSVYKHYRKHDSSIIPFKKGTHLEHLKSSSIGVISSVMGAYSKFSAIELMGMTHSERPWQDAYASEDKIISQNHMKKYYKHFVSSKK